MARASHVRKPGFAKQLLVGLRGRPDSEHEMSFNRLFFACVILIYIVTDNPNPEAVQLLILYCLVSIGVFIQILFDGGARTWRRLMMIAMDMGALSYVMHVNGGYGAAFYPIYLWATFGNGFRFGLPYLYAAAGASLVTFCLVAISTPFWLEMPALSVGLAIGLVILPAYAGQLIRKLSRAKQEAEEASRAKSYFLASVSHELRTPLTAIIGLSAHLQDSDLPLEQRTTAGTIATAGRSLLSLINQLLDFARLGAKGITVDPKPFDLVAMMVSVRELMKVGAGDKGLHIALHVTPRTPLIVDGDESHMRDTLVNLVGNAIKFTETGTITISADAEPMAAGGHMLKLAVTDTGMGIEPEAQQHIFDSFRQADNTIIDRFGGTGLGLAICKQVAELLGGEIGVDSEPGKGSRFWFTAKIEAGRQPEQATANGRQFILFSTDDDLIASLKGRLDDCGIALRVEADIGRVRALAHDMPKDFGSAVLIDEQELGRQSIEIAHLRQMLGHEIMPVLLRALNSEDDADASLERVFISILTPQSSDDEYATALGIGAAAGPQAAFRNLPEEVAKSERPLRILVADDNVMNQKVFAMILGRAGHEVLVAGDGEAALDVMKDHGVDIVLMDVNMPVLNGIEATKLYRFTALGRKRVPIVGITADASAQTSERCIEAGMDACIAKPVEAAPLLELINQLTYSNEKPTVPAFDPSGVVTPLFPTQSKGMHPAINWEKLRDLEELGGEEFVADLLGQYVVDAQGLIEAVAAAVEAGHVEGFRDGTHALRSSGANIGADQVAELCLHFQRIDHNEFEAKGAQHLAALRVELDRVREALTKRRQETMVALRR